MLAIEIHGRPVVLVGGGPVAERKARTLLATGAALRVISPVLSPGLQSMQGMERLEILLRPFQPGDTAGAWLVVAATGSREVDAAVATEAERSGALLCVAARPELGNVHFPAEVQRGPITIGIATGGASPALARVVRQKVAAHVGPEYGLLAELLAELRERLRSQAGRPQAERARLYESLVNGPVLELLARGEVEAARAEMERAYRAWLS